MTALLPTGWPRPRGYANGVSASGRMVFVAGMIGWDADGRFAGDDIESQSRQALANVVAVLAAVVVRIRAEETLWATEAEWSTWAARVRWRLVPGVW